MELTITKVSMQSKSPEKNYLTYAVLKQLGSIYVVKSKKNAYEAHINLCSALSSLLIGT